MSVSGELLCSFELLKPLDSSALKNHIKKGRSKRNSIINSPVSFQPRATAKRMLIMLIAGDGFCPKLLIRHESGVNLNK